MSVSVPYTDRVSGVLCRCCLLLALLAGNGLAAQDSAPPVPERPPGLETVEFFSPAVERTMKYDIVLPEDYHSSDKSYPVLYLLHGFMQNYTVWGRNLGAAFYARNLGNLILVMPDAGNSWYVNYAESPGQRKNNWEDHIIEDVIGHVDGHYRTEARREGRAIAGLSMGGYGAFMLGLRHPDMFVSMASTSGALGYARDRAEDIRQGLQRSSPQRSPEQQARLEQADEVISGIIDIPGFSTQAERTPRGRPFVTVEQAEAHDPFTILYQVSKSDLPHIHIDSGTRDGMINVAREFARILMLNDVAFDYMQSPGGHDSEYWRRSVGHFMPVQHEVMHRALGNRP